MKKTSVVAKLVWLSVVLVATISFAVVFADALPSMIIFGKFNLTKIIVYVVVSSVVFALIFEKIKKITAFYKNEKIKKELMKKVEENFAKSSINKNN